MAYRLLLQSNPNPWNSELIQKYNSATNEYAELVMANEQFFKKKKNLEYSGKMWGIEILHSTR